MKTLKNLFLAMTVVLLISGRAFAVDGAVEQAADKVQSSVSQAADNVKAAVENRSVAEPTKVEPAAPAAKTQALMGAGIYSIDPAHSTIGFSVKHLQISNVKGAFNEYTGTVTYDPNDVSKFKADVEIKVASIDTNNAKRDEHLRSNDFFGADEFPVITFKSNQLEKRGEGYVMVGNLTIRGVPKQLTFPVRINGPVEAMGAMALGMSIETSINRQDFKVSWNKKLDNGGYILDDKVDLNIELELNQGKK